MTTDSTPARLSIYDAAAANRWRTLLLIALFTALIAVLAYFVGEYFAPGGGVAALPFAFAISQSALYGRHQLHADHLYRAFFAKWHTCTVEHFRKRTISNTRVVLPGHWLDQDATPSEAFQIEGVVLLDAIRRNL